MNDALNVAPKACSLDFGAAQNYLSIVRRKTPDVNAGRRFLPTSSRECLTGIRGLFLSVSSTIRLARLHQKTYRQNLRELKLRRRTQAIEKQRSIQNSSDTEHFKANALSNLTNYIVTSQRTDWPICPLRCRFRYRLFDGCAKSQRGTDAPGFRTSFHPTLLLVGLCCDPFS